MSRHERLAESATLAALLSLAAACSSAGNPPPAVSTASDASDDSDAGQPPPDVDVDAPLTPEGCQQGQACSCVGSAGVCTGGTVTPRSCAQPLDCEPNRAIQLADMLCVAMGDDAGRFCAKRCAKMGGCAGGAMCPAGYVCESPPIPIGAGGPVCIVPSMVQPPQCNQQADCTAIPGSTCTASGCVLQCTL
jgi:hypothetical protein